MIRALLLSTALLTAACDDGAKAKAGEAAGKVTQAADKVGQAAGKVGQALDKLDAADVAERIARAREAIQTGVEPADDCAWVARLPESAVADATRGSLADLRRVCDVDAPLARATRALARAEKARAELPDAPSLTECSSDDWGKAGARLDGGAGAGEPRWAELKARWAKACAGH